MSADGRATLLDVHHIDKCDRLLLFNLLCHISKNQKYKKLEQNSDKQRAQLK